jgi:hypothetical protein
MSDFLLEAMSELLSQRGRGSASPVRSYFAMNYAYIILATVEISIILKFLLAKICIFVEQLWS